MHSALEGLYIKPIEGENSLVPVTTAETCREPYWATAIAVAAIVPAISPVKPTPSPEAASPEMAATMTAAMAATVTAAVTATFRVGNRGKSN
jgi:hypothetical protein